MEDISKPRVSESKDPGNGNGSSKKKGLDYGISAKKVWSWFHEGLDMSSNFRKEASKDCRYYDGDQWTQEEKDILNDRGQPALVINRVKPTVDLITGTESKTRVEFHAAPRTDQDVQDASIATEAIKYVMDQNEGEYLCAEAFSSQTKAGWGIIEVGESDDPFKDPIRLSAVPRNELVWDPYAKEFDLSDAKYQIRSKWLELEDAIARFPKHQQTLEMAVSDEEQEATKESPHHGTEDQSDRPGLSKWLDAQVVSSSEWIDKSRKRVRLLECWYKQSTDVWFVENELSGDVDEFDPRQAMEVLSTPGVKLSKRNIRKVRICIVAGDKILEDNSSPYRHNQYPFIPFWCYRKDEDGSPYGVIRQIRDPQDEINKRRSKAMHLLNSRQIIATSNAIDQKMNDWREVAKQAAKPDGKILLDAGANNAHFEFVKTQTEVEAQFKFEQEAKGEIEEISGVLGELKGAETNATSGKAIIARQVQGTTMLGMSFDNYRRSRLLLGNLIWAMIQQYFTKPKMFRVTDKMGGYQFLEINKYLMDGGQILIQNDITKSKVDIVIDETTYHATIRQALMEQMMTMVSKLPPDIALMLLDMVVEYSDLPRKEEMVGRIKQIQGMITNPPVAPPIGGGVPGQQPTPQALQ